jgi:hypothetical protein
MNAITKVIDTLTGRKVNATSADLKEAVAKARAEIDAKKNAEEAEEAKTAKAGNRK